MDFVAVDVETANSDWATICQIGVAHFDATGVRDTWTTLVDPEDYFDGMNVSIHGITEQEVRGAPRFPDVFSELSSRLNGRIVVHHMPFDRVAFGRAAQRYDLPPLTSQWLDSAKVARRAWARFAERGYGLGNLAHVLDIPLDHHDALSDAKACGLILQKAVEASGVAVQEWLVQSNRPIAAAMPRAGDPAGHLFGEQIVFTGKLSMPRRKAAELAVAAGLDVADSVSHETTVLVVGTQDLRRTLGKSKSSKHRKAEKLIGAGCHISIIGEEDFLALLAYAGEPDSA